MKKHFIFMTIYFSLWSLMSLGAEAPGNDFNILMQDVANNIKDHAIFSEFNIPQEENSAFKTVIWPSLISAYEKSKLNKRVIWLNIVREVRKYDRTEREKNRPNRWYLGNLLDLTLGLENSEINDAWKRGLREAYRESL